MNTSSNTEAQPVEISEDDLDRVAGGGGLMLERRGNATVDTFETDARRGIIVHE